MLKLQGVTFKEFSSLVSEAVEAFLKDARKFFCFLYVKPSFESLYVLAALFATKQGNPRRLPGI
jgi:hypothetical protein